MAISELEQALSNTEFIKKAGDFDPIYYVVLSTYSDGTPRSYISIYTSDDVVSNINFVHYRYD